MGSIDVRKLWKHWGFLRNELPAEELVERMVDARIFTLNQRHIILNVQPNTRQMKADMFLHKLVDSGDKGFAILDKIMYRDEENRFKSVMERLELGDYGGGGGGGGGNVALPNVAQSRSSRTACSVRFHPPSGNSTIQRTVYSSTALSRAGTDISLPGRDGETNGSSPWSDRSASRRDLQSECSISESIGVKWKLPRRSKENSPRTLKSATTTSFANSRCKKLMTVSGGLDRTGMTVTRTRWRVPCTSSPSSYDLYREWLHKLDEVKTTVKPKPFLIWTNKGQSVVIPTIASNLHSPHRQSADIRTIKFKVGAT